MTPGDFFAESHLTRPTRRVALDSFIFIVALKCPETLKSSAAVDNPKERLKRVAVDSPRVALDCVLVRGVLIDHYLSHLHLNHITNIDFFDSGGASQPATVSFIVGMIHGHRMSAGHMLLFLQF